MKTKTLATLLIVLSGAFWGSMGIFVRYFNGYGVQSMEIVEIRAICALVTMFLFILIKDRSLFKINIKHLWCFIGTGVVGIMFFNWCYFTTIKATSLSVAAVLMYTAPIFVMLISALLFKEKITVIKVIALVMAFVGCMLVGGVFAGEAVLNAKGLIVGIMAGVGYALYTVFTRYAVNYGYSPMTIMFYTFLCGAITGLFLADFEIIGTFIAISPVKLVIISLIMGLVTTAIPNVLYTFGLQNVDNGRASVMASVEPVMATIYGIFIFHEIPTFIGFVGIILVLGALTLLNLNFGGKKIHEGTDYEGTD